MAATETQVRRRAPAMPATASFVGAAVLFGAFFIAAGAPTPLLVELEERFGFASWELTLAFGVYAFALLAALLVVGSLSDYVGRRLVLIGALVIQIVAMLMFAFATNIDWVIAARAVQGIATGAATSAFTALLVELAPEGHKRLGSIMSSVAPPAGLGVGALVTGVAVRYAANPSRLVFVVLSVVMALGIVVALFSDETVRRRPVTREAIVPRVSVPPVARREFWATVPVIVGAWALAGLFLGLAPTIIRDVFGSNDGVVHGAAAFTATTAGAITSVALGRVSARRAEVYGTVFIAAGAALVVVSVGVGSLPLLFVGGLVSGIGLGAGFSGSLRAITPLAPPDRRAAMFAAFFVVSYLSFGLPAIIAGELVGTLGLMATAIGYGVVVVAIAAAGLTAQLGQTPTR